MFYVYVLQSESDQGLYIGYSSDLRRRLREHQSGQATATAHRGPWKLIKKIKTQILEERLYKLLKNVALERPRGFSYEANTANYGPKSPDYEPNGVLYGPNDRNYGPKTVRYNAN